MAFGACIGRRKSLTVRNVNSQYSQVITYNLSGIKEVKDHRFSENRQCIIIIIITDE